MPAAARLTALLVAATAVLGLTAQPAVGAGESYVALGDSYSSGTGTRSYVDDGTECLRSAYAYPSLIASRNGYALNLRACSGATVADVTALQLSALTASTRLVTVSVGGNDAGFADVLTECALPAWASDCHGAVDASRSTISTRLPGRLASLFGAIRARAPRARVVAAGYPRIFNGEDCNALTWFSPQEEARLNQSADLLNSVVRTAAGRTGVIYADPTPGFLGHAVCDDPEWINGLSRPLTESYHPNRLGQSAGYRPVVESALTGQPPTALAVRSAALSARQAESVSARLARQQRRYASGDRTVRPETVRLPDLRSPAVRRAAARAGVDLDSRASIDAADRRFAEAQAERYR